MLIIAIVTITEFANSMIKLELIHSFKLFYYAIANFINLIVVINLL